ncbi:MAG: electron transfer flavoprotein subunit alpha/FixB family protein [Syntrophorhabdaceae bacterium]|nr:electron transfer flavoprotein subunit alpha/FixB family protein [Syntrophorhabdaceae bacterium]
MAKDIFVFIEGKDEGVRKSSIELLSKAKGITKNHNSTTYGILIGPKSEEMVDTVRPYPDKLIVVRGDGLDEYRWDTYTPILERLIKTYRPFLFLGPSTITGKDLFPRLAARLGAAYISDATGIEFEGEEALVKKAMFGGKIISWMGINEKDCALVTFRPNSFSIDRPSGMAEVIEEMGDGKSEEAITVLETKKTMEKKVDLQEADFIICGGRGMKGPEQFGIIEEIASLMEGRVGASRAVVDAKWRDYEDQIGKSGKTVSPKLYIGCGVSGALHHTMGMDTSKVIVAINKDPNAPIFQYADYGIVDDLFDVLPALKEELKKLKEQAG